MFFYAFDPRYYCSFVSLCILALPSFATKHSCSDSFILICSTQRCCRLAVPMPMPMLVPLPSWSPFPQVSYTASENNFETCFISRRRLVFIVYTIYTIYDMGTNARRSAKRLLGRAAQAARSRPFTKRTNVSLRQLARKALTSDCNNNSKQKRKKTTAHSDERRQKNTESYTVCYV